MQLGLCVAVDAKLALTPNKATHKFDVKHAQFDVKHSLFCVK